MDWGNQLRGGSLSLLKKRIERGKGSKRNGGKKGKRSLYLHMYER